MESLNLNTLASSLPNAQQNAEKELLNNFKAAALSITTLYRSSRTTSKRAYNAGYAAACDDLLNFIQQGVSVGGVTTAGSGIAHAEEGGMSIGRVMDWIEARLEAVRAREEEEDEEEEKEKERARPTVPAPQTTTAKPEDSKTRASSSTHRPKNTAASLPPTPSSPASLSTVPLLPAEPSSPSPPPSTTPTTMRVTQRLPKPRSSMRGDQSVQHPSLPSTTSSSGFNFDNKPSTPSGSFPETPIAIGPGAKRRHAVMMMLDSASSPVPIGGSSASSHSSPAGPGNGTAVGSNHLGSMPTRRRTRNTRGLVMAQPQAQNLGLLHQASSEAMDIEEDGRERKRVARERRQ